MISPRRRKGLRDKVRPMTSMLVLVLAPLLLGATVGGALAGTQPAPKRTAWVGATVYDETGIPGPTDRVVVTRGDRIEALWPADAFRPSSDMSIVDLKGKFLIPGLINTHVHLATSAVPDAAGQYLRRELFSGVTALRDMAGDARLLAELKREAEFDEIPSPDIDYVALLAGREFFLSPKTQAAARGRVAGEVPWMQAVDDTTDLRLAIARAKGTGASGIKIYADVSAPLLAAITREAHAQGLRAWSHAAVFPARPSDAIDAGVDVVSHACMLGYEVSDPMPVRAMHPPVPVDVGQLAKHGDRVDSLLARMKAAGTILDATLFVYFADDSGVDCTYATAADLAARANRAGVAISTGTDDEPGDYAGSFSALLKELALLHHDAGMSTPDVLRAGTIVGARVLGHEKDMGTIEPGKLANFVVLDKDPLQDIAFLDTVSMTVKHGVAHHRSDYRPPEPAR
jgi:imidazolonepropionase-like amidohydrolase